MTWEIDFTESFRTDLVGLDESVEQAVMDTLIEWLEAGPPRENARTLLDIEFFEAPVAEAFLPCVLGGFPPPAVRRALVAPEARTVVRTARPDVVDTTTIAHLTGHLSNSQPKLRKLLDDLGGSVA